MKLTPLPIVFLSAVFGASSQAATLQITDSVLSTATIADISNTGVVTTPSGAGASTVTLGGGNSFADFNDFASGVSYYRLTLSGLAGDVVQFAFRVNRLAASATGGFLGSPTSERDAFVSSSSTLGSAIDITTGDFNAPGPGTAATFTTGTSFSSSFTANTNFDEIYIRAEFWGGNQNNASNRNESRLIAVPEPSSISLLGLGALGLVLRRKR